MVRSRRLRPSSRVRRLFTDEDGPLAPFVDLSLLKFKERDQLEDAVKSWRDVGPADIVTYRQAAGCRPVSFVPDWRACRILRIVQELPFVGAAVS
jgi:hypothetical protein